MPGPALSTLSEQMRSTKSRPYQMRRRAELVDETRQRITEAAVRLHTTVGPAHTTIAAVADEAGVTRLTVYRHFADLDELFVACRTHWMAQQPPPDASAWPAIADLETRARHALTDLYAWYRERGHELYPIYRDAMSMPLSAQEERAADNRRTGDALVEGHAAANADGLTLRAVARHLVDFGTWRSLAVQNRLEDHDVVDIGVQMLMATARRYQDPGPTA
jgi:AcrR family transcriptional regulator